MASPDALLDPLRVPRQVVVYDQRAELKVHAFGSRLGREKDRCVVTKMLDQRRSHIDRARSRSPSSACVPCQPVFIDFRRFRAAVRAVEHNDLALVAMCFQKAPQVLLRSAGFREDSAFRAAPVSAICARPISSAFRRVSLLVSTGIARARVASCRRSSISSFSFWRSDRKPADPFVLRRRILRKNVVEQLVFDFLGFDQALGATRGRLMFPRRAAFPAGRGECRACRLSPATTTPRAYGG